MNGKTLPTKKTVAVGASIAALAAATYYFFGPEGKKHQRDFKGWMIKMKADIVEKIEDVGEVTEPIYDKIVDGVALAYAKAGKVSEEEVAPYADILKKQWKNIVSAAKKPSRKKAASGAAKGTAKKGKSASKSTGKKASKGTSKKTARK